MRITAPWLVLALALTGCEGGAGPQAAATTPPPVVPEEEDDDDDPPLPPAITGPWRLDMARGHDLFVEKCERCHGVNAAGGYGPALTNPITCRPCSSFAELWPFIDDNMPLRNPAACDAQCSRDIASWLMNGRSTAPSCSLSFDYVVAGADRYSAILRIANTSGQAVSGWRLGLTLPSGQDLITATGASIATAADGIVITPDAAHAAIANGATVEFGIQGTHGGSLSVPPDLRLEASPCFVEPSPL